SATGTICSRMTRCDRSQASAYDVCGSTTAGTRSTTPAFHAAAFMSEVFMPATLFFTTSGSALDSGNCQCALFITEWITRPVSDEALAMASTSAWSSTVCISMPSNPTAFASANRSCQLSSRGSIEMRTARLMPVAGWGGAISPRSRARSVSVHAASGTAAAAVLSSVRRVTEDMRRFYPVLPARPPGPAQARDPPLRRARGPAGGDCLTTAVAGRYPAGTLRASTYVDMWTRRAERVRTCPADPLAPVAAACAARTGGSRQGRRSDVRRRGRTATRLRKRGGSPTRPTSRWPGFFLCVAARPNACRKGVCSVPPSRYAGRSRRAGPGSRDACAGGAQLRHHQLRLQRHVARGGSVRPAGVRQHLHPHHEPHDGRVREAGGRARGRGRRARPGERPGGGDADDPQPVARGGQLRHVADALRRHVQPVQAQ